MKLTDTLLRSLKASGQVQKKADGGGLYIHISPTGGKLWRMTEWADYPFSSSIRHCEASSGQGIKSLPLTLYLIQKTGAGQRRSEYAETFKQQRGV